MKRRRMKMNMYALHSKSIYPTYKDLCTVLQIPFERGNSKIARLKELESICKYHREGRSYVIDEVYTCPKKIIKAPSTLSPHTDTRHFYNQCTVPLFFSLFNENNQILTNNSYLFQQLGFANTNFGSYAYEREFLNEHPDLKDVFYKDRRHLYKEMSKSTQDTIREYKKEGIITKERVVRIKKNDDLLIPQPEDYAKINQFQEDIFRQLNIKHHWEMNDPSCTSNYRAAKAAFCLSNRWEDFYFRTLYVLDPERVLIHPFSEEKREEMKQHVNNGFYDRMLKHGESEIVLNSILKR